MKANVGKGVIFDVDGTLLDSMGVWDQIDIVFLHERGFRVPQDYMAAICAMPFRQIAEYTIERFRLDDTPEELMAQWSRMAHTAYTTTVEPKPFACEYVKRLYDSGARLAVATSLPADLRDAALRKAGLLPFFEVMCSVDEAGDSGKDSPDVYLLAAERLGVAPADCTVFEDVLAGIRAAKSVGMSVWAMHDDSSDGDWDEICAIADGVLFDFSNAPTVL